MPATREHDRLLPGCPPLDAEILPALLRASPLGAPAGVPRALHHLLVDLSDAYELLRQAGGGPPDEEPAVAAGMPGWEEGDGRGAQQGRETQPAGSGSQECGAQPSATECLDPSAGAAAPPGSPGEHDGAAQLFARSTSKFWVPVASVYALKCAVVRHLPLLIYGRPEPPGVGSCCGHGGASASEGPGAPADERDLRASGGLAVSGGRDVLVGASGGALVGEELITSVYYENAATFEVYDHRLARTEGATLVRVRWYGDIEEGEGAGPFEGGGHGPGPSGSAATASGGGSGGGGDGGIAAPPSASLLSSFPSGSKGGDRDREVYVERKTHHESWSGLLSCKERFGLNQKQVSTRAGGPHDDAVINSPVGDSAYVGWERPLRLCAIFRDFSGVFALSRSFAGQEIFHRDVGAQQGGGASPRGERQPNIEFSPWASTGVMFKCRGPACIYMQFVKIMLPTDFI